VPPPPPPPPRQAKLVALRSLSTRRRPASPIPQLEGAMITPQTSPDTSWLSPDDSPDLIDLHTILPPWPSSRPPQPPIPQRRYYRRYSFAGRQNAVIPYDSHISGVYCLTCAASPDFTPW
jgi:hypothetical protein